MNNSKFLLVRLKLPIHTGEVENPNLFTGGKTGQKKAPLQFHDDQELKLKWIYFVNRKYWLPTAHSVICIDLFEEKFIKRGKKCQLLCCGKYILYL